MKRIIPAVLVIALLGILLKILNSADFETAPKGYPIILTTHSGEKIYFRSLTLGVVDLEHPENSGWNNYFQLHTDSGLLEVPRDLRGVRLLEVVTLPAFLDYSESQKVYSEADLKAINEGKKFLHCKVRVTFDSGKILEAYLLLYGYRNQSKVSGSSLEGERRMDFAHVVSVKRVKEKEE